MPIFQRNAAELASGLLLVLAIVFLANCSVNKSPWVHFKINVEVEADGEIYSGSSVLGMRYANKEQMGSAGLVHQAEMKGEAIFVDIGSHGTVFVLLSINKDDGFPHLMNFFDTNCPVIERRQH